MSESAVARLLSAWRHDIELLNIRNFLLLECVMHSKARSVARASAMKMELWWK